ncbi:MAG: FAD-dependent oxidoreductase [Gammaproteobacteria bacterium]|nr:FAD-dependent oxidoreductase [Gammaproteobacteria bacterium]
MRVDAVIVGGGIAGLWLARLLSGRGYAVVLLEADALGGSQTLASQGMIHGGLKYALSGSLSGASEAIADMPRRWARCLDGDGEIDLRGLAPLSQRYYMFAAHSTLGRLTTFFASRALRGRIERLAPADYPPALADPGFRGVVYALNDFVLDTPALLDALLDGVADRVYRYAVQPQDVERCEQGIRVAIPGGRLLASRLVLTAGAGSQSLLEHLGIDQPRMQLRPLHQVVVRHAYPHPLYAHCLTGIRRPEPRLTITSHCDGDGWLWYLGGQIASDGVTMSAEELAAHARKELQTCLPWIDWRDARVSTLRIDRAEPEQDGGRRPDEAFAAAAGDCIVAWPTKLSLVPDLGDKVLDLLPAPQCSPAPPLELPRAAVGRVPWAT